MRGGPRTFPQPLKGRQLLSHKRLPAIQGLAAGGEQGPAQPTWPPGQDRTSVPERLLPAGHPGPGRPGWATGSICTGTWAASGLSLAQFWAPHSFWVPGHGSGGRASGGGGDPPCLAAVLGACAALGCAPPATRAGLTLAARAWCPRRPCWVPPIYFQARPPPTCPPARPSCHTHNTRDRVGLRGPPPDRSFLF